MNTGGTTQPNAMREVLEEVDRAIALDPSFADAYGLRANAYLESGRRGSLGRRPGRKRVVRSTTALALQPDKPYFLLQLALIQMNELDLTAAQQTLERVRSISSRLPPSQRRICAARDGPWSGGGSDAVLAAGF